MLTSLAFVLFATMLSPEATAPCEKLTALSLPHTTITSVKFVAAGRYTSQGPGGRQQTGPMLPDHCRVVAVAAPSSDSHIEIEIWLPAQGWNGKFLAVGNGGGGVDRLIDLVRRDLGPRECFFERDGPKLRGGEVRQFAEKLADRRANGGEDEGVRHETPALLGEYGR